MMTRLTSVPTAPLSFAGASGLWRLELADAGVVVPAHEKPSPPCSAPAGSTEHPGCGGAVVSTSLWGA